MCEAFPLDPEVAGIGSDPRAVALDTELLYVHPRPPTSGVWEPDEFAEAYPLLMNLNEGRWTVLNWGYDAIPIPGFPPILDGASLGRSVIAEGTVRSPPNTRPVGRSVHGWSPDGSGPGIADSHDPADKAAMVTTRLLHAGHCMLHGAPDLREPCSVICWVIRFRESH
jgi:hypothetical protein